MEYNGRVQICSWCLSNNKENEYKTRRAKHIASNGERRNIYLLICLNWEKVNLMKNLPVVIDTVHASKL